MADKWYVPIRWWEETAPLPAFRAPEDPDNPRGYEVWTVPGKYAEPVILNGLFDTCEEAQTEINRLIAARDAEMDAWVDRFMADIMKTP